MKHYYATGRRKYGRPLKRLLDTWDRNGSTGGPTAWQIDDDDGADGYEYGTPKFYLRMLLNTSKRVGRTWYRYVMNRKYAFTWCNWRDVW
jgi:hypothetical protein